MYGPVVGGLLESSAKNPIGAYVPIGPPWWGVRLICLVNRHDRAGFRVRVGIA